MAFILNYRRLVFIDLAIFWSPALVMPSVNHGQFLKIHLRVSGIQLQYSIFRHQPPKYTDPGERIARASPPAANFRIVKSA
jgi:hypothetical protein